MPQSCKEITSQIDLDSLTEQEKITQLRCVIVSIYTTARADEMEGQILLKWIRNEELYQALVKYAFIVTSFPEMSIFKGVSHTIDELFAALVHADNLRSSEFEATVFKIFLDKMRLVPIDFILLEIDRLTIKALEKETAEGGIEEEADILQDG